MKAKQNKIKGITLVALVVTIIILLIISGVAISLITGEDGLFAKANHAVTKYKEASQNEQDQLSALLNSKYLQLATQGTVTTISQADLERIIDARVETTVADLNTQIANLNTEIETLKNADSNNALPTVILYPNGTAQNPATISRNQRITVNNPYPGHRLHVVAEVYYNNQWGETGFVNYKDGGGAGVKASQLIGDNSDIIVIQSGNFSILMTHYFSGSSFGVVTTEYGSLPYRLIVTCLD